MKLRSRLSLGTAAPSLAGIGALAAPAATAAAAPDTHSVFAAQNRRPGSHDTHGNWARVWSITNC
ncbi:hypothetical protein GCM10010448_36390 [Streptomyces glomeratus]|uniref:Uncharacterized protein n=1 Tax=Streptomyces glomeratus TaxID=284452 RepID=A0ABP6LPY4_9ACTN